jgi:hypothetical protein
MNYLLWLTVGFFSIGFTVLIFIKRKIDSKKNPNVKSIVWWITGITAWGIGSIFLVVWLFHTVY